jgi:hypothetical protein
MSVYDTQNRGRLVTGGERECAGHAPSLRPGPFPGKNSGYAPVVTSFFHPGDFHSDADTFRMPVAKSSISLKESGIQNLFKNRIGAN